MAVYPNLSEDVKRGMLDGARKCQVVGAIPYGYKKGEDGRFAIDEVTAPIVQEIFDRVKNGVAFMEIARSLNARGLKKAGGKPWNKGSFHGILHNERYTGTYLFKDIRIEGGMPQIISKEVFDALQEIRKERNAFSGRHRSNNDFLLTGKLFCGKCLSPMVGVSGKGRHGDVHYYYRRSLQRRPAAWTRFSAVAIHLEPGRVAVFLSPALRVFLRRDLVGLDGQAMTARMASARASA